MPSVQVKHVPPEAHAELTRRAEAAHQSLQEYLLSRLIEIAETPTLDEVLDRIGQRTGGSVAPESAVELIHAARDGR